MKKIIVLLLITSTIIACDQKGSHKNIDQFYINKGGFDLARVPLIKPYEITTPSTMTNWIVKAIDTTGVPDPIPGTKYVNIIDSIIFIYGQKTMLDAQEVKEAWFVIIPKTNLFRGFKTKKEYLNYLSSIGVKDPKMYDIMQVFHYFDSKDTLDWKDINRKYLRTIY